MKIRVTLKDPDTMHDAVDRAMKQLERPDGLSHAEWSDICEARASAIKGAITNKWMKWGEYLIVDFTVNDDEQATHAEVVANA